MNHITYITITYKIEVTKTSKDIPNELLEDFNSWLQCKAIELGLGCQWEFYTIGDDYKNDIEVDFIVNNQDINKL